MRNIAEKHWCSPARDAAVEQMQGGSWLMKICVVDGSYPNEKNPQTQACGTGFLSRYIDKPTLYITKAVEAKKKEVPDHVVLKEISYREERTPIALRDELYTEERRSIGQRALAHLRIMRTMRGVAFFLKSIPALIAFRPDIIACHQNVTIFHGVFAKYCLGSKFVLHLHNNSEVEVIRNLWLLRVLVERADSVFCLSATMGKMLEDVAPSVAGKIRYTTTGVDPTLFKNMGVDRKNQLVAIGSFKWKKGYKYLLDAMPQIFSQHPEYFLVIVGDGEQKEAIVKQIEELGISDKVELTGIISRQRVMELLNESKIFVMSSLREGLPKALLEALTCGTPAVITTGCNADDIIQGRGLLVETNNSKALAEAIIRLIDDKELWQRCSVKASTIIEDHTWEKVAQQVYRNYKEIFRESVTISEKNHF